MITTLQVGQKVRRGSATASVTKVEPGWATIRLQNGTTQRLPDGAFIAAPSRSQHPPLPPFCWYVDQLSGASKPAQATPAVRRK